jgi:hypothetical protein
MNITSRAGFLSKSERETGLPWVTSGRAKSGALVPSVSIVDEVKAIEKVT